MGNRRGNKMNLKKGGRRVKDRENTREKGEKGEKGTRSFGKH